MKITFGALITDGTGKLGGHAAQHGRAGAILRTIKQPSKSPTLGQSLRRQDTQVVAQSWRTLTESQRKSWNDNAPIGLSGFDFYMQINLRLLSISLPLLSSFIPPTTPQYVTTPLNQAMNVDFVDPYIIGTIYLFNNFNSFITTNWSLHILWTGWIPPSVYRYPKMTKVVQPLATQLLESGITMNFDNTYPFGPIPTAPEYKAKFDIGFINNNTGQRNSQGTYEYIAVQNFPPSLLYNPQTSLVSSDLVPVTGGYNLTANLSSGNAGFNFDEWEPWFYLSEWIPVLSPFTPAITNYISPDHLTFNDSSSISLLITHAEGAPLAPPGPGYLAYMQIGWKQKGGGQVVSEQTTVFYFP